MRLFCFPYAGGGARIYRRWSEFLPFQVEVCPVQLPGRENRVIESPYTNLSDLISDLVPALEPYLDKPFAFLGHSMGALISFELTRHLRKLHWPLPEQLFLFAHSAPHLPRRAPTFHDLAPDEFVKELEKMGGTPAELLGNKEVMQVYMPLLRADFTLCEMYKWIADEPLDLPLTVFGGTNDDFINHAEIAAWREHTRNTCQLHMFSGSHFFIHEKEAQVLQLTAQMLNQSLERI